ncbi:MAG: hypothetical protein DRG63_11805 [Deltaproteobacteria bacterium]|nr:MAG: hypothetical protein DRG63_11805 [Deltaproteobacteria bacterium]
MPITIGPIHVRGRGGFSIHTVYIISYHVSARIKRRNFAFDLTGQVPIRTVYPYFLTHPMVSIN